MLSTPQAGILSIAGNNPTNFYEVLDGTWWAIDRHLMMDGTRASATALHMDSIKQGVTTIFDHHASYGEIPGTLHTIAEESKRLGLRSCLCYEVSDRDGEEKCLQAIQMCIRDRTATPSFPSPN